MFQLHSQNGSGTGAGRLCPHSPGFEWCLPFSIPASSTSQSLYFFFGKMVLVIVVIIVVALQVGVRTETLWKNLDSRKHSQHKPFMQQWGIPSQCTTLRNQSSWCFKGCETYVTSAMCVCLGSGSRRAFEIYHTFIWFRSEFISHGRGPSTLSTWHLYLGGHLHAQGPDDQSRFQGKCQRWTGDSDPRAEDGRVPLQTWKAGSASVSEERFLQEGLGLFSVTMETHFS